MKDSTNWIRIGKDPASILRSKGQQWKSTVGNNICGGMPPVKTVGKAILNTVISTYKYKK